LDGHVNGLLVDLRDVPRQVQVIAHAQGDIPYIPAGKIHPESARDPRQERQVSGLAQGTLTAISGWLLPDHSTGQEWRVPARAAIHAREVERLELVDIGPQRRGGADPEDDIRSASAPPSFGRLFMLYRFLERLTPNRPFQFPPIKSENNPSHCASLMLHPVRPTMSFKPVWFIPDP
jgi:hypothetical protein